MSKDHDDKFDSEEPELEFSLEEILAEFSDRARKEPDSRMPIPLEEYRPDRAEPDLIPVPPVQKRKGGRVLHFPGGGAPAPAGAEGETASASPAEDRPAQVEGEDTPPPVPEPVPEPEPETPSQTKEEPEEPLPGRRCSLSPGRSRRSGALRQGCAA